MSDKTERAEKTKEQIATYIKMAHKRIEGEYQQIRDIAKIFIPDFHFMSHKVSLFWSCDKSPIGMCVFYIDHDNHTHNCYYCHKPETRK